MSESTVNCPTCLRPAQTDASECPGCSSTLLVDVIPSDRPAEAKSRYQLARALAAVAGAPPLAALRAALETEGAPLVHAVTRAAAARFETVLSEHGILALLEPTTPVAPPRPLTRYALPAAALALIVVGTVCVARKPGTTETAVVNPYPTLPVTGRPIRAVATVRCPNSAPDASGFFVSADRLLVAAHSLCDGDGPLVRVSDGRELLSSVLSRSTRFDLAIVEVDRAGDVQPIPLGDATTLRPGDRVQIVGGGAGTSVRMGRVAGIASEDHGIGWLRIDAGQQPVGDGDALLDAQGRLVGMLRARSAGEESVRALPVNYGYDPTENGGLPLIFPLPSPAPDENLWRAYLRKINDDEVTRGRAFVESLERRPGVFESSWFIPGDSLSVKTVVRSLEPPQLGQMEFDLRMYGMSVCSGTLEQSYVWDYFDQRSNLQQARSHARWNWISQLNLGEHLYIVSFVGKGGPFRPCLAGRSHVVLHVKGAAQDLDTVPLQMDM